MQRKFGDFLPSNRLLNLNGKEWQWDHSKHEWIKQIVKWLSGRLCEVNKNTNQNEEKLKETVSTDACGPPIHCLALVFP